MGPSPLIALLFMKTLIFFPPLAFRSQITSKYPKGMESDENASEDRFFDLHEGQWIIYGTKSGTRSWTETIPSEQAVNALQIQKSKNHAIEQTCIIYIIT